MPIKIEQVTETGLIIEDYDEKLTLKEIKTCLSKQKNLIINTDRNPFVALGNL